MSITNDKHQSIEYFSLKILIDQCFPQYIALPIQAMLKFSVYFYTFYLYLNTYTYIYRLMYLYTMNI